MVVFKDVAARLAMLGLTVTEEQRGAVEYAINLAFERLTAAINRPEIPQTMQNTFVDVAAGIFLQNQRGGDMLTAENDDAAGKAIKHITEGDVSVEYDTAAASENTAYINSLIERLANPPISVIIRHRRLAR